jgi:putative serine protease PepD
MTSVRVTAQGRSYAFPPGTVVSIGCAPDCDIVLQSPDVAPHHARLVPNGDAWYLTGEEAVGGIWVAGRPVSSLAVTGPVTAQLGDSHGTAEIRVEPITEPTGRGVAWSEERGTSDEGRGSLQGAPQASRRHSEREASGGQNAAAPGAAPVLVTRLGRQQRIFPMGTQVRVGRDPSLELVSVNPLVSRQCHGVITSDEGGATYVDQSRRGTFLNGKQLRGPLRITESVVLRLGDPATGEELGITPPLSSSQLARNQGRRVLGGRVRKGTLLAAAVVVAAGLAAGIIYSLRTATPASSAPGGSLSGGLQPSVLRHAEAATVRLLLGDRSNYTGWGSGTVVGSTGLILTNAHVAEPQAPGAAVAEGVPASQLDANPPYLTVELTTGPSSPVVARYRARPVAVDGYLDLAVVQIYATDSGQPVSPGSLHLPYLRLGNVGALQLDQTVTVLGFPGVAQSDSITVTSGVVSTFVPDPLRHVGDPRFELETTARVAHGNSGGAAINNAGQLIGVPSLAIPGEGGDVSWRLRSVAEATALITAARDHTTYHSKILVQLTGAETVAQTGVAAITRAACSGSQATTASSSAVFGIDYARLPVGLDIAMLIGMPDGTAVTVPGAGLPQAIATTSSGCFGYRLTAAQLGLPTLPVGTYQVQLLAGPNLTPVSAAAHLDVTAPTAVSPPVGAQGASPPRQHATRQTVSAGGK